MRYTRRRVNHDFLHHGSRVKFSSNFLAKELTTCIQ